MKTAPMLRELVLLTGEIEAPYLSDVLRRENPELGISVALDCEALSEICRPEAAGTRRLIAFCTGQIVPGELLEASLAPAYNFHPGPPNYPGSCGAGFALYEHAERFGVTVHEMTPRVDEGAIVAVEWFNIPEAAEREALEAIAFKRLIAMFHRLAPHLACSTAPLPPVDVTWSGSKRTKAEAAALATITDDLEPQEIERRRRAFG